MSKGLGFQTGGNTEEVGSDSDGNRQVEAAVAKAVKNVSRGNFFSKGEYVLGSSQRTDAENHNNPNAPEGFLNRVPSLDLGDDITELVSVDCEPSISGKA